MELELKNKWKVYYQYSDDGIIDIDSWTKTCELKKHEAVELCINNVKRGGWVRKTYVGHFIEFNGEAVMFKSIHKEKPLTFRVSGNYEQFDMIDNVRIRRVSIKKVTTQSGKVISKF